MVEVHSRIEIPADLAELAAVREAVRDVARHCEAPATCMDDLVQAVDEAVTNVIVHGYLASVLRRRQLGERRFERLEEFDP